MVGQRIQPKNCGWSNLGPNLYLGIIGGSLSITRPAPHTSITSFTIVPTVMALPSPVKKDITRSLPTRFSRITLGGGAGHVVLVTFTIGSLASPPPTNDNSSVVSLRIKCFSMLSSDHLLKSPCSISAAAIIPDRLAHDLEISRNSKSSGKRHQTLRSVQSQPSTLTLVISDSYPRPKILSMQGDRIYRKDSAPVMAPNKPASHFEVDDALLTCRSMTCVGIGLQVASTETSTTLSPPLTSLSSRSDRLRIA